MSPRDDADTWERQNNIIHESENCGCDKNLSEASLRGIRVMDVLEMRLRNKFKNWIPDINESEKWETDKGISETNLRNETHKWDWVPIVCYCVGALRMFHTFRMYYFLSVTLLGIAFILEHLGIVVIRLSWLGIASLQLDLLTAWH